MLIILCLALVVSVSCYETKIIGGTPTTITEHPYQVSIHYDSKFACGGSIISRQWILTVAHCIYGGQLPLFSVRVGSTYYDKEGTLIKDIAAVIFHKKYHQDTYDYDVGLIKLSTALKLGPNIKAIVLALPSADFRPGIGTIVAGWGKTSANGTTSKMLRHVAIPVIDQEECRKIYARYRPVTSNMLCAGDLTGKRDACQGDSGGALVYSGVQIGIVSWGARCAGVGFPGVYTRVSAIRQWITEQANV